MKDLSAASREQIRDYSKNMAETAMAELQTLVQNSPDEIISDEYDFLVDYAKEQYKIEDKKNSLKHGL